VRTTTTHCLLLHAAWLHAGWHSAQAQSDSRTPSKANTIAIKISQQECVCVCESAFIYREISDLGHFGGGHIPCWVMDPKLFRFGSIVIYQTPTLSNHSDLAPSQTTAT
jgi:hypothetical protein